MVFHWSLNDSKSPQVSRTLLSILAVLSNAVICIVLTRPPTSKSSRPFNIPLVTVPNAPITIGIIVLFIIYLLIRVFHIGVSWLSFTGDWVTASLLTSPGLFSVFWPYYYYLLIESFSHQYWLMVFHWRLSDSKSPQVSRTLLSILAVFNNAVVWMVSTCPPTSKSSSPFINPLVTVPKAPITIGIIVTFMFHYYHHYYSLQIFI